MSLKKSLLPGAAALVAALLSMPLAARDGDRPRKSGVVEVPPPQVLVERLGLSARGGGAGPNVLVNQDGSGQPQNETTIAFNPLDIDNLVGGANDYRNGDATAGWYTSFDGGMTWTDGVFPLPGNFDASGDPGAAFGPNNRVHFSMLIFQRDNDIPPSAVYVSTSTDGGQTWGPLVNVSTAASDEFDDKELIACDITGGIYNGNVYVSWTKFKNFDSSIYFSRSTDSGASFSTPARISDTQVNQGSMPAVGPGGEVYVVWKDYIFDRILIDRSFNGGATFGSDRVVANTVPVDFPLPGFGFRGNSFPYIAVDRSGGPYHGRLYSVWCDERNNDADIYMAFSDDQGASWSSPSRVNDDAVSNGQHQFFPFVTVTEGGAVDVMYYDTGYGSYSLLDVTLIRSNDGGLTFDPSIRVTDVSFDPDDDGFGGAFIGDYNGMASTDNASYPLWTDTRSGTDADVYISRVELALQSDRDSVSASAPAPTQFILDAGPARWGKSYLVAGTASGTEPGTPYGPVIIPLNVDSVTWTIYNNVNKPSLQDFFGVLDNLGRGNATLAPASKHLAPLVGKTLHFAFITPTALGADFASQPVSLDVVP